MHHDVWRDVPSQRPTGHLGSPGSPPSAGHIPGVQVVPLVGTMARGCYRRVSPLAGTVFHQVCPRGLPEMILRPSVCQIHSPAVATCHKCSEQWRPKQPSF